MIQWVKIFTNKLDDLSLIPRSHKVKRENQLLQIVL